jgi:hypothetical protein
METIRGFAWSRKDFEPRRGTFDWVIDRPRLWFSSLSGTPDRSSDARSRRVSDDAGPRMVPPGTGGRAHGTSGVAKGPAHSVDFDLSELEK